MAAEINSIDSFINGVSAEIGLKKKGADYHQSAISSGSDTKAAAYIELEKMEKLLGSRSSS